MVRSRAGGERQRPARLREKGALMLEVTSFGSTPDGAEAHAYTLSTAHGARDRLRLWRDAPRHGGAGARDGSLADVVLGFADVKGYAGVNGSCYGGVIGPMANRTDRAEVPIDGTVYHLLGNDGPNKENNLHSDLMRGLHKRLWDASFDEAANNPRPSAARSLTVSSACPGTARSPRATRSSSPRRASPSSR